MEQVFRPAHRKERFPSALPKARAQQSGVCSNKNLKQQSPCVLISGSVASKLEDELAERMLAAFREAKRLKYNAARFFQMLNDRGALATAKSLLAGDVNKVSDGFTAMWNLKRLDLTVEAICLEFRFKTLFTQQELATARKRLENAGYSPNSGLGSALWMLGNTVGETMKNKTGDLLRVFLCHSSGDKPAVRKLYQRLKQDGFAPWLDEEDLLPGQDWRHEISVAVRACSAVVVCLSRGSITKVRICSEGDQGCLGCGGGKTSRDNFHHPR